MLEQLKRPFKKVYGKVRSYVSCFVGPVKDSASKLFALIPGFKAFAGSEDLANADDADGTLVDGENGKVAKPGLRAKLKNFKQSLKGLSDAQKLILLTIAVVLPAGIVLALALASFLKKRKK
ncbi:hypothetical protein [Fibrobacter sp.]|uniref:hypothetical protein n=1 Tax=Fibrobacter sp. TaxID=35828 RepID=UPI003863823E